LSNAVAKGQVKGVAMTGNEAVAQAMRQIHPDVVAAYPITPQTEIVQIFSTFVADGLVQTEFVPVESEHSAMSATVGAAASGARAMTATSANGLALMWEILYIAASTRLPIVMPVVNRALSAPINIHCDHSDTMGARDSGWIQLYSESAQEAYDNMIQAVRIAEHPDVLLPVMVTMDGFIISHGMENVELNEDNVVSDFIGEYQARYPLLDVDHPKTVGPLDLQDYYFEHKRQQVEGIMNARQVILDVGEEYGKLTGRKYGFLEEYMMEDAEVAAIALGSTAGTAKFTVDKLREKGIKAGLIKLRVVRPFPVMALRKALTSTKAVAVMDRADSFSGIGGPMFAEVKAGLYDAESRPLVSNYVYGLGGRDTGPELIETVYNDLLQNAETGEVKEPVKYLGVRE